MKHSGTSCYFFSLKIKSHKQQVKIDRQCYNAVYYILITMLLDRLWEHKISEPNGSDIFPDCSLNLLISFQISDLYRI
jgi:hypothetical protein